MVEVEQLQQQLYGPESLHYLLSGPSLTDALEISLFILTIPKARTHTHKYQLSNISVSRVSFNWT